MPLDLTALDARLRAEHTSRREWEIAGHPVAWLSFRGEDVAGNSYSGEGLYCECDLEPGSAVCPAKEQVWPLLLEEARAANRARWQELSLEDGVFDIFNRVRAGERLGQRHEKMIYLQEVSALLERPQQEVFSASERLYAKEQLDLAGSVLIPYEPRFRFPRELQALIALIHEEPLGWPNGEAGDGLLHALESAIGEHTRFKHGRDAFHGSWPHLEPRHLTAFALRWLQGALAQGTLSAADLDSLADDLNALESRVRAAAAEEPVSELSTRQ